MVPPEIVKVSVRRSIFSEPESPETVRAVPTAAVVTEVTKPLALTVTTGIKVCEPKDPTLELTVANVVVRLFEVISPDKLGILVVEVAVPVTLPTKPEVAVITPDATTLVKEMFGSRLTVRVLLAADEFKFVPPEIVNTSLRRLMFSEPESPATVNAVPTDAVPAAVILPLESTVNVATSVDEP